jgi:hypothetical protein
VKGRLKVVAPKSVAVEPEAIELAGLREGEEKVVRLRVRAAADAPAGLDALRVEPVGETAAGTASLPVSVGVVLTEDRRIPMCSQWVVRAPGYTLKVDHQSGVACYLLDPDGHRRHGHVNNSSHSYLGIGAVESDGRWPLRYRTPCRFIAEGKDRLTVVNGSGAEQVRLRYVFHEDRVSLSLVPPTDRDREYTLWLGDFDALGPVRHTGKEAARGVKDAAVTADWYYFPHPVRRHGLLVLPPPKTPLRPGGSAANLRIRAGQEVVLQFATEEELGDVLKEKGFSTRKTK